MHDYAFELAALSEPELVAQSAAEALGVREEAGRPILKTLCEWLQERRLLIVLDNCEHLVPAVVGLADITESILRAERGEVLKVVVDPGK